jgi:hypothetical protein
MKKRLFILLLVIPFVLSACSKGDKNPLQNLSEMELAAGQKLITGQVTSRVGNDIELALGTLSTRQSPGSMGEMPSGDMGSMPSGEAGAMPSGERGAMPSGERGNWNGGGNSTSSGSGTFPGRSDSSQNAQAPDGATDGTAAATGGTQIQLSGETMSVSIPVGTKVLVTTDGVLSASSFGRIQTDDILELIVQTNADGSQTVILAQIMES